MKHHYAYFTLILFALAIFSAFAIQSPKNRISSSDQLLQKKRFARISKFLNKKKIKISADSKIKTKEDLPEWPQDIEEILSGFSETPVCDDSSKCRAWEEIKDIAYCKASLVASRLDMSEQSLYFAKAFKSLGEKEYSKFVFVVVDKGKVKEENKVVGGISYLRLCVPVLASDNAYIDLKCPFDDCEKSLKVFLIVFSRTRKMQRRN